MEKQKCKKIANGQILRYAQEDENTFFVYAPNKKRYGWRMHKDDFLRTYTPIPSDEGTKWKRKINTIIKRLEKSGLWPEMLERFKNLQELSYDEWKQVRSLYWSEGICLQEQDVIKTHPFLMSNGTIDSWYICEQTECRTKSMHFGCFDHLYKAEIKRALEEEKDYSVYRAPASYDVSYEYNVAKKKAWYSEEYRGCGNGHYYIALDGTMALFTEND